MATRSTALSSVVCLGVGVVLGALSVGAGGRPSLLLAGATSRAGESILATGPIATEQNQATKTQITHDAIYYLNYSKARLMACVPSPRQTATSSKILTDWAERDLLQDFGLTPESPTRFLMTTGLLGGLSEGWAPLYVIETLTGQVAVYRVVPQVTATSTKPAFVLLERRADPRLARALTSR